MIYIYIYIYSVVIFASTYVVRFLLLFFSFLMVLSLKLYHHETKMKKGGKKLRISVYFNVCVLLNLKITEHSDILFYNLFFFNYKLISSGNKYEDDNSNNKEHRTQRKMWRNFLVLKSLFFSFSFYFIFKRCILTVNELMKELKALTELLKQKYWKLPKKLN